VSDRGVWLNLEYGEPMRIKAENLSHDVFFLHADAYHQAIEWMHRKRGYVRLLIGQDVSFVPLWTGEQQTFEMIWPDL